MKQVSVEHHIFGVKKDKERLCQKMDAILTHEESLLIGVKGKK